MSTEIGTRSVLKLLGLECLFVYDPQVSWLRGSSEEPRRVQRIVVEDLRTHGQKGWRAWPLDRLLAVKCQPGCLLSCPD